MLFRSVFRNKLTRDDRLLLAFDALVLSQVLGREVSLGKIIHGDDHATLKVKTPALIGKVRKRLEKVAVLLSNPAPPDLVLNRHCAECEFQARCRKIAVEKDDLSLLARMTEKERKKLRSKGIFTVTQLSYTFRPRRRPKRLRDKREKYHHSLKALAIREKKIHIVGSPELKIEGTPVYLDVEGLPDRDFYYLIGVRIGNGESAVQHSLWADTVEDEGKIWREFLAILETVEKPVLIHYGSYETTFFGQMGKRYGATIQATLESKGNQRLVNLLSFAFGQVYFPTFSNTLKEAADYLLFRWTEAGASGLLSIVWRLQWEASRRHDDRERLIRYNLEDCKALDHMTQELMRLCRKEFLQPDAGAQTTIHVDDLRCADSHKWGRTKFSMPDFDFINEAAYWDYQRERVYVKTHPHLRVSPRRGKPRKVHCDKDVECGTRPELCPNCGHVGLHKHEFRQKIEFDLRFTHRGVTRCITRFRWYAFRCPTCRGKTRSLHAALPKNRYGAGFVAYLVYNVIDLLVAQSQVMKGLNTMFGFQLTSGLLTKVKARAAEFYRPTYERLLKKLREGSLLHADETAADVLGARAYVWVFASLEEVAYVYAPTREADTLQAFLRNFVGVLVSDFYAAYDSINCPQQKCLIHFIRDLNEDLLKQPFNLELRSIASKFGALLRSILLTVDRYGLKARFLRRHRSDADGFLACMLDAELATEVARGYQKRFEKHGRAMFLFLEYDGVPWNNNNAEHAVKAFAFLRNIIGGSSTEKGFRDYLVLLSVCETCRYRGLNFLDFLRSRETDLEAFTESRRERKRPTQPNQPTGLPADAIPGSGSQP